MNERIEDYITRYKNLVELEREQEMREHEAEIRQMSGRERERAGRAIRHLRGRQNGRGLGGFLVKFMRQKRGEPLPDTEIKVGNLVMLSKQSPYRDDNPTGTVSEMSNRAITVVFRERPHKFTYGDGLRMDLYVNDVTYQRQLDALALLGTSSGRLAELRDILVGLRPPRTPEGLTVEDWINPILNDSQKTAVRLARDAPDFFLIHGPPGTGKTTTLIEVIEQAVVRGERVLATAASNTAVDNMLEKLAAAGVQAVRVGHPARVSPLLRERTVDALVEQNQTWQRAQELREQAFDIKDEQRDYAHPSGQNRRGLSNKKIKKLAAKGRSKRGVDVGTIQQMATWIELQEEVGEIFGEADRLKERAVQEVIEGAEVVCTTNSTAGSSLLADHRFDLVAIDEATQATEPSCLVPICHGDKIVMAGDHRQLPPVVKNQEAAEDGLMVSLFERLAEEHGERIKSMLEVQYRMHEDIMRFSSEAFYEQRLVAHDSVRQHTLADLELDFDDVPVWLQPILATERPVVFVDTAEIFAPETQRERSTSKRNAREADIVRDVARALLDTGLDATELAIIAPYAAQVELLREHVDREHVEIKTVDGFQGREKEVVVMSLTRSNDQGLVGFLDDVRRFNVALTRARRKVIVVGDSSTVSEVEAYEHFVEYAEALDAVVTLQPDEEAA
ncbi:MAG: IGHMBP2 family helicase [Myxococcota bacterium]